MLRICQKALGGFRPVSPQSAWHVVGTQLVLEESEIFTAIGLSFSMERDWIQAVHQKLDPTMQWALHWVLQAWNVVPNTPSSCMAFDKFSSLSECIYSQP